MIRSWYKGRLLSSTPESFLIDTVMIICNIVKERKRRDFVFAHLYCYRMRSYASMSGVAIWACALFGPMVVNAAKCNADKYVFHCVPRIRRYIMNLLCTLIIASL